VTWHETPASPPTPGKAPDPDVVHHDISSAHEADTLLPPRPTWLAIRRGFRGRCPKCGQGKLFRAFLKVADYCPVCGEALHHHRADDAPAYFVILIVGHIVVPMVLATEVAFSPPYWVHAVIWLPLTVALAVGLLGPVKGAIVGWQWANYMHGFDPHAEADA
jgi:uncharacterized protein (DUF983 family)